LRLKTQPARVTRIPRLPARSEVARRTLSRAEARALRLSLPEGIERDTFLMPRAIAESVCAEASRFLDEEFPARYADWLVIKAHRCYSAHRHFYKLMQARGNVARDRLYMFMRHWLASFLHLERPDLFYCLPITFGDGRRLPPGTHPRIHRNGFHAPLPKPRDWNEQRVYRHFRWTWLRAASSSQSGQPPLD
jgi:hypothetical protein